MTDDIKLLKECDSGVKMGIQGISEVIDSAYGENFKNLLKDYESQHINILNNIQEKLSDIGEETEEPHPIAKINSKITTNFKLMLNNSDEKIADLMMDGCNMGIKSVSRYMNEYSGASKEIMDIANEVVLLEQNFVNDLRQYL